MNRSILAHIRAIRFGHSERALVQAVDARGLEYKLEVPTDEVRGVVGDMLVLSWSIHDNPAVVTTPTSVTPTSTSATATSESPASPLGPAAVDEQFDVLMRGGAARSALTPEQQLAALLGSSGQKPG